MNISWVSAAIDVLAAAILLNAALGKIASPNRLLVALDELVPRLRRWLIPAVVRCFAVIEIAGAVGLLFPETMRPAALLVSGLGLCFVALGAAGWLRGSAAPCGCLGGSSERPLGAFSVAMGITMAGLLPLNLLVAGWAGSPEITVMTAALASLLLCVWLNARLALQLLRRSS